MLFGRNDAKAETPVLLPGQSCGQRSLVGYSPRGCKESDMTERFHFHFERTDPSVTSFSHKKVQLVDCLEERKANYYLSILLNIGTVIT